MVEENKKNELKERGKHKFKKRKKKERERERENNNKWGRRLKYEKS